MEFSKRDDSVEVIDGPFELNSEAFLLCPPFNISSRNPNNKWMVDAQGKDAAKQEINRVQAFN